MQSRLQTVGFTEFLAWYPANDRRYELINGEIIEMRPTGDHERITAHLVRVIDREIERLGHDWFIPKTACLKPAGDLDGYIPDVMVLDRQELAGEPLWKKASTLTQGRSTPLVVEVVSTNWHDDYAKKLDDYEALGIGEYWIVDYRGLGGRRFIGFPKQPTLTVCTLTSGEYQLAQFRAQDILKSSVFPELKIPAVTILA
ncbi:Uncharacterized protein conserved in cyanobacteria [Gloeomargarita lithophora Alchichica-D10]|uniref:Uncharacterized protein conserved in cyanobacteria n=1 Tax=Gloeomargarita lithophora Alchichica-D10 TaxID=1188229 RepID=A0A1J0AF35_9CYAN|nr:Uma2 family endonuclease [Gloeomargarita lithophora]APB34515.1 Uncharacterized protein conserved in cyanobacteria [Gloeomargarita lithophora Alchichica-D10]